MPFGKIAAMVIAGVAVPGVLQAVVGALLVHRFARRRGAEARAFPAITVLKPLHGDEPLLEEALASVCRQDYPSWQIVFGVQRASDAALSVVRRAQSRFPACDIAVVVDAA